MDQTWTSQMRGSVAAFGAGSYQYYVLRGCPCVFDKIRPQSAT